MFCHEKKKKGDFFMIDMYGKTIMDFQNVTVKSSDLLIIEDGLGLEFGELQVILSLGEISEDDVLTKTQGMKVCNLIYLLATYVDYEKGSLEEAYEFLLTPNPNIKEKRLIDMLDSILSVKYIISYMMLDPKYRWYKREFEKTLFLV